MGRLIVDGSNVLGARPDGWWRDRAGARVRLTVAIDAAAPALAQALLGDPDAPVLVVHDGPTLAMQVLRVDVRFAPVADDLIAALATAHDLVVTSDRELAERATARGAGMLGAGQFRRLLDEAET
jgi:hypothetical protein